MQARNEKDPDAGTRKLNHAGASCSRGEVSRLFGAGSQCAKGHAARSAARTAGAERNVAGNVTPRSVAISRNATRFPRGMPRRRQFDSACGLSPNRSDTA